MGMVKSVANPGRLSVVCPCADSHTSESNETATIYMLPMFGGVRYGRFHCLHSHCENRPQEQFIQALGLNPKDVWRQQASDGPEVDFSTPTDASNDDEGGFRLLSLDDLLSLPPLRWRVRGVLPESGLAAVFGPSGSGKSFLAIDLCMALSDGVAWFGHRVQAAPVLYCALEGESGISNRVRAFHRHHGHRGAAARYLAQPFDLLKDVQRLADAIIAKQGKGGVVFLDTLNRAAPGIDENSSEDMGRVITAAKCLQRLVEGLVVLVHHSGKDQAKGLRGHSSLHAALDAAIEVKRDGDYRSWKVAKSKDGEDGKEFPFALHRVVLGEDEDGEEITSCVIEPGEASTTGRKLSPGLARALDSLISAIAAGDGEDIALEDWRRIFYASATADSTEGKRSAFNRARQGLVSAGLAVVENDCYSLARFEDKKRVDFTRLTRKKAA
jgi:hypothetical protein